MIRYVGPGMIYQNTGITSDWETYESQLGRFSIDKPVKWLAMDLQHGNHGDLAVVAVITNRFPRVVVARIEDLRDNDQIADLASVRAQKFGDYQWLNDEIYTSDNGISGHLTEYLNDGSDMVNQYKAHCLDWSTTYNNYGYIFTFCAEVHQWPEYASENEVKDAFLIMINSIEFMVAE